MRISYWPNGCALNGAVPYQAALDGIGRVDNLCLEDWNADAALIWSVLWNGRMRSNHHVWEHYRKNQRPVIVIEVGALQRGFTWRFSANGINRTAIWPTVGNENRAKKFAIELKAPTVGSHVLICMQQRRSEQWHGMPNPKIWLQAQIQMISAQCSLPIIVRTHPREPITLNDITGVTIQKPKFLSNDSTDFEKILANCQLVVSHNSNPGIEAVIAGKRVFCDSSSLAWPMSVAQWDQNIPDRSSWFHNITHSEWSVEELASGEPWFRLRHALSQAAVI